MDRNTSILWVALLLQLFLSVSSSQTTESSSSLPPTNSQAGRCSRTLHQSFDPLMNNLIANIKSELANFQQSQGAQVCQGPQVMISNEQDLATLVAEKLFQRVKDDLITSGTGIISEELNELTGIKVKLEERFDLIEETIEENKASNNQKLESLVESTASNNERLDSLKETIEENEVSNNERFDSLKETIEENEVSNNDRLDSIEETLEKNKQHQIYFSAYNNEGGEVTGDLKFPKIVTNLGGAFDGSSGVFTAPVKGVYTFSFSGQQSSTTDSGNHFIDLFVIKNGATVLVIYDDENTPDENQIWQNINSIFSLELNENDTVKLQLDTADKLHASSNARLTFMGQLVVAT